MPQRAARRKHLEIALREPFLRLFVNGIERIHEAVAESIGIDIEGRVNEMRDVAPIGLVTLPQMNGGTEAFALNLDPDAADIIRCKLAVTARGVNAPLERIEGGLSDDRVQHVLDLGSKHRLAAFLAGCAAEEFAERQHLAEDTG